MDFGPPTIIVCLSYLLLNKDIHVCSVSQNPPPPRFSDISPKRLGICSPHFTRLLRVPNPIYTGLQFFYSVRLPAT